MGMGMGVEYEGEGEKDTMLNSAAPPIRTMTSIPIILALTLTRSNSQYR